MGRKRVGLGQMVMKNSQGLFPLLVACILASAALGFIDHYVPLFPRPPQTTTTTSADGGGQ